MAEIKDLSLKEVTLENPESIFGTKHEKKELIETFKICLQYSEILDKLYIQNVEKIGILCKLIENPKVLAKIQEKCKETRIQKYYIEEIVETPIEIPAKNKKIIINGTEVIFIDSSKGTILVYFCND